MILRGSVLVKVYGITLVVFAWVFSVTYSAFNDGVRFEMLRSAGDVSSLIVHVPTLAGVRYQLRETETFEQWESVGESFVGTGSGRELKIVTARPAPFYKVVCALENRVLSAVTGIEYPIHVVTPAGYETNGELYPVAHSQISQPSFESALDLLY